MRSRILVIDDEPGMLRAVERILSTQHEVVCTSSPAEGLRLAAEARPDLAICDISMPRMDGFELMTQMKLARPDLDVIIMTGMSDPDMQMVRAIREGAFYFIEKPFNREVMRTLVERCLELRRLRNVERSHRERIDGELAEARTLQQSMLPPARAAVQGVQIVARCVTCSELGGDMYDYADAGTGRAAVFVADVAGHGVSAALLTAVVKSAFAQSSRDGFEPLAVVRRVAGNIAHFSPHRFVTLLAARIDLPQRRLEFVNAGHPAGLLWTNGQHIEALHATGPLISQAFGQDEWEQREVAFPADAKLLVYTDGVADAVGGEGGRQRFSAQRLTDEVTAHPAGGRELLDAIFEAVARHTGGRAPADDLTLLTARAE